MLALPSKFQIFGGWIWEDYRPHFEALLAQSLGSESVDAWLKDWSRLSRMLVETQNRLSLALNQDTTDQQAKARYEKFLDTVRPPFQATEQALREKLLASGLEPAGMAIPLRNMRSQVEIFRQENLPLLAEEAKLCTEYDELLGAQTVSWDGQEITIPQLATKYYETDRQVRERAYRLAGERLLRDRPALNLLWVRFLNLRRNIAANAGLPDYRQYIWRQTLRFDYTPADCERFHQAIEQTVVPVVARLTEKRRQRLGIPTVRPWDQMVDPLGRAPLKPYQSTAELEEKAAAIFQRVDPQVGAYFQQMRQAGLLDLDNRKGKSPGAYCTSFDLQHVPFIFCNSVGLHEDVATLLHEAGHAFHVYETAPLPYYPQLEVTMEIAEVASMSMELLAAPYLSANQGGYYSAADAARARIDHLEEMLRFWPYMAVVDAFQHWVYTHPDQAGDLVQCDAAWLDLYRRFIVGIDWSGFEDVIAARWQRQLHIFENPFYYVEYGLAQLGAVQIWANALRDQPAAVAAYRKALALGGTAPLPDLYAAAGARLAFDAETLQQAVELMENTIIQLEQITD